MTHAQMLAEVAAWPEPLRADWEERCALIQYGCRCGREESEVRAYQLLRPLRPAEQMGLQLTQAGRAALGEGK